MKAAGRHTIKLLGVRRRVTAARPAVEPAPGGGRRRCQLQIKKHRRRATLPAGSQIKSGRSEAEAAQKNKGLATRRAAAGGRTGVTKERTEADQKYPQRRPQQSEAGSCGYHITRYALHGLFTPV